MCVHVFNPVRACLRMCMCMVLAYVSVCVHVRICVFLCAYVCICMCVQKVSHSLFITLQPAFGGKTSYLRRKRKAMAKNAIQ
jgi:hypothetical protein